MTVTANSNIKTDIFEVDATSANRTFTLPLATEEGNQGRTIIVKKKDATANTVTISAADVEGSTTYVLNNPKESVILFCNGATWTVAATAKDVSGGSVANALTPVFLAAAQQALSGAGAINVTTTVTKWTTTAADAGTLADGVILGQIKKIQLIVDGGDGTLTPVNLAGGTTITFADAGDFAVLQWNGADWVAIELGNDADGATAPVLA